MPKPSPARPKPPALPAQADLDALAGDYTLPDGGVMTLARRGTFLHASGARVGLALPFAKRLVVCFGPLNQTEIGAYTVTPAEVRGLWVPPGADQADFSACGVEVSTPDQTDPSVWRISAAIAIDNTTYAGKVERTLLHGANPALSPKPVHMLWRLDDGEFRSFALDFGNAVYSTFCFQPEQPHGLAVYALDSLAGFSLTSTSGTLTSERLQKR